MNAKDIHDIVIPLDGHFFEGGNIIRKLGQVNFFVGENNAGKSRLMRAILSSKLDANHVVFVSSNILILESLWTDYKTAVSKAAGNYVILGDNTEFDLNKIQNLFDGCNSTFIELGNGLQLISAQLSGALGFGRAENGVSSYNNYGRFNFTAFADVLYLIGEELKKDYVGEHKCIYIPSVRSLRVWETRGMVERRIRKDYFNENDNAFPIIENGESFFQS